MFPTPRFLRLLLIGSPFWLLVPLVPMGWLAPTGFLTVLLGLALRDLMMLPRPGEFKVRRYLPTRFSFDTEHKVGLEISSQASSSVHLEPVESLPELFDPVSDPIALNLQPGQQAHMEYWVKPVKRGQDHFGPVFMRIRTGMGLVQRQFALDCPDEVRVYPRFLGVEQYDLLARIDEREEAVRVPRTLRGQGSDFESLRPYLPGEDLRHVDWKISAKRGSLISRNLQVERGQTLAVCIDAGRFMNERIGKYARFEHALNATTMLSYVAQRRGDALAVATFSNKIESFVPPLKGAAIMPSVLESLYRIHPRKVEADYWNVVAQVMGRLKKRSLMIMITDVLDLAGSSGLVKNLIRAARKHLVLCVVFVEQKIYDTADSVPSGDSEVWLKSAASHLAVQRRLALEQMRARGILVLETAPEHLSLSLIRKYLEIRQADLQ